MKSYSVKELSELSGVSIRTLHHYDSIDLLKPAFRTDKNYRLYTGNELYKLQQILFHKELGMPLSKIKDVLNDNGILPIVALEGHKKNLIEEQERISQLIETINKTILKLKGKKMITDKELYEGFSKNEREAMKAEAMKKFGQSEVERSENHLKKYTKQEFESLKQEQKEIFQNLLALKDIDIDDKQVQLEIARHYVNTRKFWGTYGNENSQKAQYKGLGQLYISEPSYTKVKDELHEGFSEFIAKAIAYYAKTQLK